MPAISNKTRRPLTVSLPGGKTLHVGPGKTSEISARAAQGAALKKLVEAGEIEIVEDGSRAGTGTTGSNKYRSSGHRQTATSHRSGDR